MTKKKTGTPAKKQGKGKIYNQENLKGWLSHCCVLMARI